MHLRGSHSKQFRGFVQTLKPNFDGVWIQGGAARTLFNNEPLKDFDLFFRDQTACNAMREHLYELGWDDDYKPKIFHSAGYFIDTTMDKVFFKDAHAVVAHADYNINAFAFDFDLRCTHDPKHLEQLINRELVVLPGFKLGPANALRRAYRMMDKGYLPVDEGAFWAQVHQYTKDAP